MFDNLHLSCLKYKVNCDLIIYSSYKSAHYYKILFHPASFHSIIYCRLFFLFNYSFLFQNYGAAEVYEVDILRSCAHKIKFLRQCNCFSMQFVPMSSIGL